MHTDEKFSISTQATLSGVMSAKVPMILGPKNTVLERR